MWHLTYGCVFLALNTAVAMLPAWLLGNRTRGSTVAIIAGLAIGGAASFTLGGVWFVLLPELWSPPPPPSYNRWGWSALIGCMSVSYAAAGGLVVASAVVGASAIHRWWSRRA
jgi:hypothetical protein